MVWSLRREGTLAPFYCPTEHVISYSNVLKNIGIRDDKWYADRMESKKQNFHQLERLVRGFANHRRIQILDLLEKKPELSVVEISTTLKIHFKTASEHIRRLAVAGLVLKRSDGASIRHKLTNNGKLVLKFLRTLE